MIEDEHIETGARCTSGHPLWLVAEGYARCQAPTPGDVRDEHYAWCLAAPAMPARGNHWKADNILGADGRPIPAYVWAICFDTPDEVVEFIAIAIGAARYITTAADYDETAERARLVEVQR